MKNKRKWTSLEKGKIVKKRGRSQRTLNSYDKDDPTGSFGCDVQRKK